MPSENKIFKDIDFSWIGAKIVEQKIFALSEKEVDEIDAIDLHTNGFEKIPSWLKRFNNLESLNLRSNHIKKLEGLENMTKLRYLYVEDNQINKIECLDKLKNLHSLRFGESFHFYSGNMIHKIENLESLTELRVLELANNKIQKIEGLDLLKNLECLDLSYNKIEVIEGLEELANLKILNLTNNKIQHLDFKVIPTLEELGLEGNPIRMISGYHALKKIETLYIDLDTCNQPTQKTFRKYFGRYGLEYYSKVK